MDDLVEEILKGRPAGQVASIARQLMVLWDQAIASGDCCLNEGCPVGIGVSGGRLRIAFMHPDMNRFFGPAWQMPIGAADVEGDEQVVVLMQPGGDGKIRLLPEKSEFRERQNFIAADLSCMYPDAEVREKHHYERFGTAMAKEILASLGYLSDSELQRLRDENAELPPDSRWISNNLRRPFSLLANALASLRTVRSAAAGRIAECLGAGAFQGLTVHSTGEIPQGGFSSSSAVTVAVQNATNALFELELSPDELVDLACQAEYGTGVMAGALDQATEQKGQANQGVLISSNPADNYRILGEYPVPTGRFHVLFPFSVDRDRDAWRWSAGTFARSSRQPKLTTGEIRKMTGKAAEVAALLTRLPLQEDFFGQIESDLVDSGRLSTTNQLHVQDVLRGLPLLITQSELAARLDDGHQWYADQLQQIRGVSAAEADRDAESARTSLLQGWRDPTLERTTTAGIVSEAGMPLRAMVAYLYGEVAKNGFLMHHPQQWIQWVTRSQRGDRCFDIDHGTLPSRTQMLGGLDWEKGASGPDLMQRWLDKFGARPFDFNEGLLDDDLSAERGADLRLVRGTNFFRGLALIDLAEAMLKQAFGDDAVAVRVNGAGQGDYFQVHVDTVKARPDDVKDFIRKAFYQRFSLTPKSEFVEPRPGGGAIGARLQRFDQLPQLAKRLREASVNSEPPEERRAAATPRSDTVS